MNDEQTTPTPTPTPEEPERARTTLFDLLPQDAREDLHKMILLGYEPGKIRSKLLHMYKAEGKYSSLTADRRTYIKYIEANRETITKLDETEKALISQAVSSLDATKSAVDATLGETSLANKRKVFENLFKECELRITILKLRQTQGLFDNHTESVLAGYIKQQREIMEKLVVLQEDLNKDNAEQFVKTLENFSHEFCVVVFNAYKKLNGEEKFSEFKSIISEELKKTVQRLYINP